MRLTLLVLTAGCLAPDDDCPDGTYRTLGGDCAAETAGGGDDAAELVPDGPDCPEILETVPADGSDDAYYRAPIEVWFQRGAFDAVLTLTDGDGEAVPGTTTFEDDGEHVLFAPDRPLSSSTSYHAEVEWCEERESWDFVLFGCDLPVEDPQGLVGQAFESDLANARWVKPQGVGDLLMAQLDARIGYVVTAVDDTLLDADCLGVGEEGWVCPAGNTWPSADITELPYFEAEADELVLSVDGVDVPLTRVRRTGNFLPDGSGAVFGSFDAVADARTMEATFSELLGEKADAADICELMAGFGVDCVACADGEELCIELEVQDITDERAPDGR